MKLLVTGGCGFIGSNFVRYLLQARSEWEVTVLDLLTYSGNLGNVSDLVPCPRFRFRKGGYKRTPLDAPPGPDWQSTGERFVDPTSGETLDVWFHPKSGERAYVRSR